MRTKTPAKILRGEDRRVAVYRARNEKLVWAARQMIARMERTVSTYNGEGSLSDTGEFDEELSALRDAITESEGGIA